MQFDSWQAFWNMGGYGVYVWLSFGVTIFCMGVLVFVTRRAHKQVLDKIVKERSRRSRIEKNTRHRPVGSNR